MIDITEARALVETLKDYAEHPSSFTDISPTEADAAADLIDALLDEVERLNSPVVLSEWQKLVAERDALMSLIRDEIDENRRLRVLGGAAADEGITAMIERVIAESDELARDAARYRWLRDRAWNDTDHSVWGEKREFLDCAIDSAMKGASGE